MRLLYSLLDSDLRESVLSVACRATRKVSADSFRTLDKEKLRTRTSLEEARTTSRVKEKERNLNRLLLRVPATTVTRQDTKSLIVTSSGRT